LQGFGNHHLKGAFSKSSLASGLLTSPRKKRTKLKVGSPLIPPTDAKGLGVCLQQCMLNEIHRINFVGRGRISSLGNVFIVCFLGNFSERKQQKAQQLGSS